MEAMINTINGWASSWSETVFHITWQATVLAGLLLTVALVWRRVSAPLKHALLVLGLVKFIVPPTLLPSVGLFTLAGPVVQEAEAPYDERVVIGAATAQPLAHLEDGGTATAMQRERAAVPGPITVVTPSLSSTAWFMLLHAFGVLLGLLWIARQALALAGVDRRAVAVTEGPLFDGLQRVSKHLGLRKAPMLMLSADAGPAAYGLLRPRIVLPQAVMALTNAEREAILAHEVAHHRRRDTWTLWAQTVVQIAWWFNPAVWVLGRALKTTREECCDDLILAEGLASDEGYCNTLLRTASFLAITREPVLAASMSAHGLAKRFDRIMDRTVRRAPRLSVTASVIVIAVGCLALPGLSKQASQDASTGFAAPGQVPDSARPQAISGTVLNPDGKPAAGVALFMASAHYFDDVTAWDELGISGPDGTFTFQRSQTEIDRVHEYYRALMAITPGYGPAWATVLDKGSIGIVLQLSPEHTIKGRVIDLEGRPVAGARLRPYQIMDSASGSLDSWLAAAERNARKALGRVFLRAPVNLNQPGCWAPAVTAEDGTFTLSGIGHDQVLRAVVEGPTIATAEVSIVTRDVEEFVGYWWSNRPRVYHPPTFEHIAAPTRPINGQVTDLNSGEGIASVRVTCIGGEGAKHISTRTDGEGRYNLVGLPKSDASWVRVEESLETGYLGADARLPNPGGIQPLTQDLQLLRGVIVNIKLTEAGTELPAAKVGITYSPSPTNSNRRVSMMGMGSMPMTAADGTAQLLALPGDGTIGLHAQAGFLTMSEMPHEAIDEGASFVSFSPHNQNGLRVISPSIDARTFEFEHDLQRGVDIGVALFDPAGSPLVGARIFGLKRPLSWGREPSEGAQVTIETFNPDHPRAVWAVHLKRKLAGRMETTENGAVIHLRPAGTLIGRLLDDDGLPRANTRILAEMHFPDFELHAFAQPRNVQTSSDGTFRLSPVLPGVEHRLSVESREMGRRGGGIIVRSVAVDSGETKDLGDVALERR